MTIRCDSFVFESSFQFSPLRCFLVTITNLSTQTTLDFLSGRILCALCFSFPSRESERRVIAKRRERHLHVSMSNYTENVATIDQLNSVRLTASLCNTSEKSSRDAGYIDVRWEDADRERQSRPKERELSDRGDLKGHSICQQTKWRRPVRAAMLTEPHLRVGPASR